MSESLGQIYAYLTIPRLKLSQIQRQYLSDLSSIRADRVDPDPIVW